MPTTTSKSRRRRSASPKPRPTRRTARTSARKKGSADGLPGWGQLGTGPAARRASEASGLGAVSTFRFALLVVALAAVFVGYVGHVHATRATLDALQTARDANLHLHLEENRLKGEFDRLTGPAVITRRARALGLEAGIPSGAPIRVPASAISP